MATQIAGNLHCALANQELHYKKRHRISVYLTSSEYVYMLTVDDSHENPREFAEP